MRVQIAAVLASAIGLSAVSADAVVVSPSTDLPAPITAPGELADPTSTSGFVRIDFAGNHVDGITPSALSPYVGTAFENTGLYHSVSAGAEARYAFDRPQTGLSFVFGSPDSYNTLSFLLAGMPVFDLLGDDLLQPGAPFISALHVSISDILFDEVRFISSGDAFEFTNVVSIAVPLPASLPLLLGALVCVAAAARRRGPAS